MQVVSLCPLGGGSAINRAIVSATLGGKDLPRREVNPVPVAGEPRAALLLTDVSNLPNGEVSKAPGTLGPLLEYGVLTRILVLPDGIQVWLADGYSWAEHGPRIRAAVASAVDLAGWMISGK